MFQVFFLQSIQRHAPINIPSFERKLFEDVLSCQNLDTMKCCTFKMNFSVSNDYKYTETPLEKHENPHRPLATAGTGAGRLANTGQRVHGLIDKFLN